MMVLTSIIIRLLRVSDLLKLKVGDVQNAKGKINEYIVTANP